MLTPLDLRGADGDLARLLPRPPVSAGDPVGPVSEILAAVRDEGDAAIRRLTARFDGVELDDLAVPAEALGAALARISPDLRAALEAAHEAIVAYHRTQLHDAPTHVH